MAHGAIERKNCEDILKITPKGAYMMKLQVTESELFWVTVGVPIYYVLIPYDHSFTCSIWHIGL